MYIFWAIYALKSAAEFRLSYRRLIAFLYL